MGTSFPSQFHLALEDFYNFDSNGAEKKKKKKLNTDPIPIWREDGDDEGRSQLPGPLCLAADFPSKASWKLWDLMFSLLYRVPHREMCPSSRTLQPPVILQKEMMELKALCLFVQTCRQFLRNRWPIGMQPNCRKRWRTVTHRLNFFGWSRILFKKNKKTRFWVWQQFSRQL